jgi:hypothetical protein
MGVQKSEIACTPVNRPEQQTTLRRKQIVAMCTSLK